MYHVFKGAGLLVVAIVMVAASCTEQKTTETEKTEIVQMDSVSQAAKTAREKLEDQTKAVEASIEKLDDEFKTSQ